MKAALKTNEDGSDGRYELGNEQWQQTGDCFQSCRTSRHPKK